MRIRDRVYYDVRVVGENETEEWERQHLVTSSSSVDCSDGQTVEEKLVDYESRIAALEEIINGLSLS